MMEFISDGLRDRLVQFAANNKKLVVLTGAGLSAESGIPTFRGSDGFWTVGSKNYTPTEIATNRVLRAHPLEVWKWKLHYNHFFSNAEPNEGHQAISRLEELFGDRFCLISQNIDGLHLKAGNTPERTYLIHGSMTKARCMESCTDELHPFPSISYKKGDDWTQEMTDKLSCPSCGKLLRPHVLFFDEDYNEKHFKWDSSLRAAKEAGVLLIVGTMLATNLPQAVVMTAKSRNAICINVNVDDHLEFKWKQGIHLLKGSSSKVLPEILSVFEGVL